MHKIYRNRMQKCSKPICGASFERWGVGSKTFRVGVGGSGSRKFRASMQKRVVEHWFLLTFSENRKVGVLQKPCIRYIENECKTANYTLYCAVSGVGGGRRGNLQKLGGGGGGVAGENENPDIYGLYSTFMLFDQGRGGGGLQGNFVEGAPARL
jgi:hypothetical protein